MGICFVSALLNLGSHTVCVNIQRDICHILSYQKENEKILHEFDCFDRCEQTSIYGFHIKLYYIKNYIIAVTILQLQTQLVILNHCKWRVCILYVNS